MKVLFCCVILAAACDAAQSWSYWIEPCTADSMRATGCEKGDTELAEWALRAWEQAAAGRISFTRTGAPDGARLRVYWAPADERMYGEARPIMVAGRRGAALYIRADAAQLGPDIGKTAVRDRLFRDAIVYLTCLHESGHAIGLPHTAAFDDIMYSFGYGGDILEYFARYRRVLASRDSIRQHWGISKSDQMALRALLEAAER
jgi:hypothetical protein